MTITSITTPFALSAGPAHGSSTVHIGFLAITHAIFTGGHWRRGSAQTIRTAHKTLAIVICTASTHESAGWTIVTSTVHISLRAIAHTIFTRGCGWLAYAIDALQTFGCTIAGIATCSAVTTWFTVWASAVHISFLTIALTIGAIRLRWCGPADTIGSTGIGLAVIIRPASFHHCTGCAVCPSAIHIGLIAILLAVIAVGFRWRRFNHRHGGRITRKGLRSPRFWLTRAPRTVWIRQFECVGRAIVIGIESTEVGPRPETTEIPAKRIANRLGSAIDMTGCTTQITRYLVQIIRKGHRVCGQQSQAGQSQDEDRALIIRYHNVPSFIALPTSSARIGSSPAICQISSPYTDAGFTVIAAIAHDA